MTGTLRGVSNKHCLLSFFHLILYKLKGLKSKFLARLYKVQVELLYSLWRPRSR